MQLPATIKIIRPQDQRSFAEVLSGIWACRELVFALVRREILSRYRQAVIGVLWVVIQPLLGTAIFTTIFVFFVRIPADPAVYTVATFAGLLVWQYLSRSIVDGGGSLVANTAMITKVSFPKIVVLLIVPVAAALDAGVALVALLVLSLLAGAKISALVLLAPLVIAMAGLFAFALVLWLAPLNAVYRDVGIALPFLMQIAMYVSPVVYPTSLVPERIRWLYQLNPFAVIVDSMRYVVLGTEPPATSGLVVFAVVTFALLLGGVRFFGRMEGNIVDRI